MSKFTGWPSVAVEFYRGLEGDNSKNYWTEHKNIYDERVLAPMQALLSELSEEFGESKIFRPNRDIRFSADKSPYKTAIGAMLGHGYVQFSAQGVGVGAGYHTMAPDQLDRYRIAVADDAHGETLRRVIAELTDAGIDVATHDSLKSAPRGYPKEHPRAELLRNKDIAAWKQWPATTSWLHTEATKKHVAGVLRASRPLVEWLDENVGDTAIERRR